MIVQVVSPDDARHPDAFHIFLAGGITGCPDWQAEFTAVAAGLDWPVPLALVNPRRRPGSAWDDREATSQIEWEFRRIQLAKLVAFWFPPESVCPIALYELGRATGSAYKQVVVGAHEAYPRRFDLGVQLRLARPGLVLAPSIAALVDQARSHVVAWQRGEDR